jgi:DNA modification methylase
MRIERNAVYRSDCFSLLERMDSDQVTLAYLDPPWAITPSGSDEPIEEMPSFVSRVLEQTHRILADTGTLFFHSAPGYPVYLRLILDQVFGNDRFLTQIIWPTRVSGARTKGPRPTHETITVYSKSEDFVYHPQRRPISDQAVRESLALDDRKGQFYLRDITAPMSRPSDRFEWMGYEPPPGRTWRFSDETLNQLEQDGKIYHPPTEEGGPRLKIYLTEKEGAPIGSVWDDIPRVIRPSEMAGDQTPYFTQKPVALLDRMIEMASNPGDLVLDPFCGSGTTFVSAHAKGRRWIGCDISEEAYRCTLKRLRKTHGLVPGEDFDTGDQRSLRDAFRIVDGSYQKLVTGPGEPHDEPRFVLDKPVQMEEDLNCEFKEIKGGNPVRAVKAVVDEYAVAFLNVGESGKVYWGIRDSDGVVVGVRLGDRGIRDQLRCNVTDKLNNIRPGIGPDSYGVKLHQVFAGEDMAGDLYVIEVTVRFHPALTPGPYFTGSNELFVKTDAGKKKLIGPEVTNFIVRQHWDAGDPQ